MINTFAKVNQINVPYKIGPRRLGDVVQVWAETSKVEQVLGWKAQRNLSTMMKDAWNWQLELSKKTFNN